MCLIYIVNTYPVECAELSYNCLLEMASWLSPCFSRTHTDAHTHTEYLRCMHPVAGGGAKAHRPYVQKHAAGRKSSFFAHCTVGEITLFLHKCKYPGSALLHKRAGHRSRAHTHTHAHTLEFNTASAGPVGPSAPRIVSANPSPSLAGQRHLGRGGMRPSS